MAQQLRRVGSSEGAETILEVIAEDGGVIVDNFLSPELVSKLRAQLGAFAEDFASGLPEGELKARFAGSQTKRFSGLAARAPAFAEVIDHDLLHAWASREFKSDYWVNTGQAMLVGPGSADQPLHRDCGNWPIVHNLGRDGPEATISTMLALSAFTVENGATRVVPGSHRWDDFSRRADPQTVAQAVMPAGSALLYSGKTIHGAGANRTKDEWRFGVHLSFVLGQLTPEEALPLTVPWSVAQHFSERVKAMLGYYSIKTFDGGWPALWTKDYREVRDQLAPAPQQRFLTAGSALTLQAVPAKRELVKGDAA